MLSTGALTNRIRSWIANPSSRRAAGRVDEELDGLLALRIEPQQLEEQPVGEFGRDRLADDDRPLVAEQVEGYDRFSARLVPSLLIVIVLIGVVVIEPHGQGLPSLFF
jgi:hypothetical protein